MSLFCVGGEKGIRTLDGLATIHAFQACQLNRSCISPPSKLVGLLGKVTKQVCSLQRTSLLLLIVSNSPTVDSILWFTNSETLKAKWTRFQAVLYSSGRYPGLIMRVL